jgi:serine/threonine protein kinase
VLLRSRFSGWVLDGSGYGVSNVVEEGNDSARWLATASAWRLPAGPGPPEAQGRAGPAVAVAVTADGDVLADRYRLITKIAVGGMGPVWEAQDQLLLRRVAVKQLLTQPGLGEHEIVIARNRVIREARITARLHHPNAVTLYDVIDHHRYPCLIMQFVPSVSLSNLLHEHGPYLTGWSPR